MADRLKIYACSGIGAATGKVAAFDYWTDNTNTVDNTQAANSLIADINLLLSEVENLTFTSEDSIISRLNAIDFRVVCLSAAQKYNKHYSILERAGGVICTMQETGMFDYDSLDNAERDKHLDELLAYLDEQMAAGIAYPMTNPFAQKWQEEIIDRNKVGLNATQREAVRSAIDKVSGIGYLDWRNDRELSNYLTNAGEFFLYTYMSDSDINKLPEPERFTKKKEDQWRVYYYVRDLFVGVYGTEKDIWKLIRAGIINDFKDTPENVCKAIVSGKHKPVAGVEPVSWTIEAIVAIVIAVINFVVVIVQEICKAVKEAEVAKYKAIDEEMISQACPNPEDYDGFDKRQTNVTGSGWIKIAAVATGILLLLRR